jgi:hypothetical protein
VASTLCAFRIALFFSICRQSAVFIGLIQNGMDLAQIQSYLQEVVIGVLLILAVIADQLRQFIMLWLNQWANFDQAVRILEGRLARAWKWQEARQRGRNAERAVCGGRKRTIGQALTRASRLDDLVQKMTVKSCQNSYGGLRVHVCRVPRHTIRSKFYLQREIPQWR